MSVAPFIPKEDQELPDNYSIIIYYINGKQETLELASHQIQDKIYLPNGEIKIAPTPFLEYVTKDDLWGWIPISSIQRLEFDKNFSKIVALKEKRLQKQLEEKNATN